MNHFHNNYYNHKNLSVGSAAAACQQDLSSCCVRTSKKYASYQQETKDSHHYIADNESLRADFPPPPPPPDKQSSKKRLVFLGTPQCAATSLQELFNASTKKGATFEIVLVVTKPPKRHTRKGKADEHSPVGKLALELNIPLSCPIKATDQDFLNHLEFEARPDLCITVGYGLCLPKRFLATPKLGTVNIHPSLLPQWRGASPVQRALQAGETCLGTTLLYTVTKMVAGPIIAQKEQQVINDDEDATTVLPQLVDLGTDMLLKALPEILCGKISQDTAGPQDESNATNAAPLIQSSEAELKVWQESATQCHNKLRGFAMWPGTYLTLQMGNNNNKNDHHDHDGMISIMKIKVIKTRVVVAAAADDDDQYVSHSCHGDDENDQSNDNMLLSTSSTRTISSSPVQKSCLTDEVTLGPTKKSGMYVMCHDGSILELLQVQPLCRKQMSARAFASGYLRNKTVRWVQPTPAVADETVRSTNTKEVEKLLVRPVPVSSRKGMSC